MRILTPLPHIPRDNVRAEAGFGQRRKVGRWWRRSMDDAWDGAPRVPPSMVDSLAWRGLGNVARSDVALGASVEGRGRNMYRS